MKSLVRQQFLDQTWDVAHLDDAAKFWLQLYDRGKSWRFFSRTPQPALEIRLTGFPRHTTESLREELERRIVIAGISNLTVSLADPDTLLLRSEPQSDTSPCPGLGLPLLGGSEFDGLLIEIRFQIRGGDRVAIASAPAKVSLVLVGEICRGTLFLKALWRSPWSQEEDAPTWACTMEEESALLEGFARFRVTGEVTVELAKELFGMCENLSRPPEIFERLTTVAFDGPRLPGLLVRIVAYVGLLAIFGFLIWEAHSSGAEIRLVLCIAGAVAVGVVVARFAYNECRLLFGAYQSLREFYSDRSLEPPDYRVLSADETPLHRDPAVSKYTRELEKAGFTQMGDLTHTGDEDSAWVYRVFRAPDGVTYLTLLCTRIFRSEPGETPRVWPAIVRFHTETFFGSGGRVWSVNESAYGYSQRLVGSDSLFRVVPDIGDPMEFYQSHCDAVEAFGLEKGLSPKRHCLFADYIRQQLAIDEETRQYRQRNPYSWGDHMRWYLQLPRCEQRG